MKKLFNISPSVSTGLGCTPPSSRKGAKPGDEVDLEGYTFEFQ